MIRVLDDMRLKFHNRREWRDVAAAVQESVTVPDLVSVLRGAARRLHTPEATASAAEVVAG